MLPDGKVWEGCPEEVQYWSRGLKRHQATRTPGSVPEQADSKHKGPEAGTGRLCLETKSERWTQGIGKPDAEGLPRPSPGF